MKIIDFFDKIYVINLDHRKDRLRSITKELKIGGLDFSNPKTILLLEKYIQMYKDNRGLE